MRGIQRGRKGEGADVFQHLTFQGAAKLRQELAQVTQMTLNYLFTCVAAGAAAPAAPSLALGAVPAAAPGVPATPPPSPAAVVARAFVASLHNGA